MTFQQDIGLIKESRNYYYFFFFAQKCCLLSLYYRSGRQAPIAIQQCAVHIFAAGII